jgi:hypothetical protein
MSKKLIFAQIMTKLWVCQIKKHPDGNFNGLPSQCLNILFYHRRPRRPFVLQAVIKYKESLSIELRNLFLSEEKYLSAK